jgi:hypothetical protein
MSSPLSSIELNVPDAVQSRAESQMPGTEQGTPPVVQNGPLSADLDFDLVWPDSEDLFETLMASESTNHWQVPLGTLPISTRSSNATFATAGSFHDKGPAIGAIPSGESRQAVHNVSEMVTALVCPLGR